MYDISLKWPKKSHAKNVKKWIFSCFFYVLKRFFTNWDLLSVINTYICIAIVSFKT